MLKQEWVDRLMAAEESATEVIGRDATDDKADAWTLRYCARFVEVGLPLSFALASYNASDEHDYESDPEAAADEEMSYMDDI